MAGAVVPGVNPSRARPRKLETTSMFFGLTAFVVWQTWPLAAHLSTEVWGLPMLDYVHPDVYLNLWIVASVARLFATAPWELAHLNAFYPARFALGYSEHMLGALPVTLPAYLATRDPVFTNQFLLLATFVVSAIAMALLVLDWTRRAPAAAVAGAIFATARWRFRNVPQIQILCTFYAPLVLLYSARYLRDGRRRDLAAGGGSLLAQCLCSYSLAYPMYVGAGFFWIVYAVAVRAPTRRVLGLFAAAAVATAVLALASIPQIVVQRLGASDTNPAWNAASLLREGGLSPAAWIDSTSIMFPGSGCAILALAGVALALAGARGSEWRENGRPLALGLLAFGLPLAVLATGPGDGGGALDLVWRIVPGLAHYRHPDRFAYLVWLPLGAFAGIAVALFDDAAARRGWRWAAPALVAVGLVIFGWSQQRARLGLRLTPVKAMPPVYGWLREHVKDDEPVLEIPAGITAPRGFRYQADPEYLLWSLHHGRPLVNGYSGYVPRIYPLVSNLAAQLPDADALRTLGRLTGVRWLVVHPAKLDPAERERWEKAPFAGSTRIGEDLVVTVATADVDWRAEYQRPPETATLSGIRLDQVDGVAALATEVPERAETGRSAAVKARISNAGREAWPSLTADAARRVEIVWSWEPARAAAPPKEPPLPPALLGWETISPARAMPPPVALVIPRDLQPGESTAVEAVIATPKVPGRYVLSAEVRQGDRPFRRAGAGADRMAVEVVKR